MSVDRSVYKVAPDAFAKCDGHGPSGRRRRYCQCQPTPEQIAERKAALERYEMEQANDLVFAAERLKVNYTVTPKGRVVVLDRSSGRVLEAYINTEAAIDALQDQFKALTR